MCNELNKLDSLLKQVFHKDLTLRIEGQADFIIDGNAYIEQQGDIYTIKGEYNLIEIIGNLKEIIEWHSYNTPRIRVHSGFIKIPSSIEYVNFSELLANDFTGSVEIEGDIDYDINYEIDLVSGDYLIGSTNKNLVIKKCPETLKGDFNHVVIKDTIPSDFFKGSINILEIDTDFIDEYAFDGLINEIHFKQDTEISLKAFNQPFKHNVVIYSIYDVTTYEWEEDNIIPIFKEQKL